jgi:hypothetical protein
MDDTVTERQRQEISLWDVLTGEWFKVPLPIMREAGAAVQTFAALLKVTREETFMAIGSIAEKARMPVPTVRKHLRALAAGGWIVNKGRERTRRGRPRRTCTISVTPKAAAAMVPYGVLPWWSCCQIRKVGRLPWCAKALLAVVLGRLMSLKGAAERDGTVGQDDVVGAIDNMGGANRFEFSLAYLMKETGLSRESVVLGKRWLAKHGIVRWYGGKGDDGAEVRHKLTPNLSTFRVIATPTSDQKCYLDFKSCQG